MTSLVGGAALVAERHGWVLIDDGSPARFGPALAWTRRSGVEELDVLVSGSPAAGVVARRAAAFASTPPIVVWQVDGDGTSMSPAVAVVTDRSVGVVPDGQLLRDHGCEVVYEHGELRGEVLGLEVARVVDGSVVVGVGRHDRYARSAMRADEEPGRALDEAVAAVRTWRRPGTARHPANTMRRSRWLRSVVCGAPDLVGAPWLEPVPPPLPLGDLTDDSAAPCVGPGLIVVCSVGVDLDVVPTAADCRSLYGPDDRLVIVVPEGDDVRITRELAAQLAVPGSVVTVPRDWAGLASGP